MRPRPVLVLLLVLLLGLTACAGSDDASGSSEESGSSAGGDSAAEGGAGVPPDALAGEADPAPDAADGAATPLTPVGTVGRELVRTAQLVVRVDDVRASAAAAQTAARAAGGFVAGENLTTDVEGAEPRATLVLRIPAEGLDRVLSEVDGLGDVERRDVTTEDVTEQVVDLDARLATQEASVARVRALLEQAGDVGQVVLVEGELTARQAELESLQARRRALADLTALATLTVQLVGEDAVVEADDEAGPDLPGPLEALDGGVDALLAVARLGLAVVAALLPFAVVAALVALPVLAVRRRRAPSTGRGAEDPTPG